METKLKIILYSYKRFGAHFGIFLENEMSTISYYTIFLKFFNSKCFPYLIPNTVYSAVLWYIRTTNEFYFHFVCKCCYRINFIAITFIDSEII